ncbi:hypothetical protein BDV93DRAFT_540810 [Ceratobasidium sp. AG-I]|nr:hypothetical protein BDV93DRAFT_540810 [Ceratobasidium sp. AG-I]
MESQIETMKDSLAVLKAKKKNNPKVKQPPAPPPKEKKAPIPPPKKPVKKSSASYVPPYTPAPGPSRAKPAAAKPTPAKTPTSNKKNGAGSDTERIISTSPSMVISSRRSSR